MDEKRIDKFGMAWSAQNSEGKILLKLEGGQNVTLNINGASEFAAIAAIFQHEPLRYDANNKLISTYLEDI